MSDDAKSVEQKKWLQHLIFNGYDAIIRSNIPPGYLKALSQEDRQRITDELTSKVKRDPEYVYKIANKIPFNIHVKLDNPTAEPIPEPSDEP